MSSFSHLQQIADDCFITTGVELYCADNLHLLPLMGTGTVHACITDPPYGSTNGHTKVGGLQSDGRIREFGFDWDTELPLDWLEHIPAILVPGASTVVWTGQSVVSNVWGRFQQVGLKPKQCFYWRKKGCPNPRKNFVSSVEVAVFGRAHGKIAAWNGGGYSPNIIESSKVHHTRRIHPTEKPVEVIQHLVEISTDPDMVVLDPFMGSASTCEACIRSGRRFVGIERDHEFFTAAVSRIKAVLRRAA